ncbi:DivIVA domain-containing protein [Kribbella sp. NPDC056345]|uniref:DivIVA domain-containing protein n=1 Tax=Kribbella sp. NPDC056345 TaxID=3345789 RepID=UPI0035D9CD36
MFTRVRWREGYDIDEVNAFVERLAATVEGRYVDAPVTAADIRNASFTPVRFREGYSVDEVDAFLDQAAQGMAAAPPAVARPVDQAAQAPAQRQFLEPPRFTPVKLREGYDMEEVDDFVDRVLATVNGVPVDRPVTAREISTKQFSSVRIREGYDVMEVDLFLEEAERRLSR